ncbi:4-(cytidine 5'-diphospho)-2-C-methyl-D-erythritol kinase, partial [Staphylococcus aureus]
ATLRGLNRLFDIGASLEELALLGSKIGTDIPFCIYNKTALCTGRGEKIEFLNKPPSAWVILAKPNLGISSPDIFKLINLDKRYDVHTKMCYEALENRDYQQLCQSLSNRLEPISVSKHPQIDKLKNNMLKSGADGALMSGSGPTVYGLARKESQAKNIYNAVNGCCNEVYLVRLLG